jgi:hypothetical protein
VAWRPEFLLNIGIGTHKFGLNIGCGENLAGRQKTALMRSCIGAAVMSALGQKQTFALQ